MKRSKIIALMMVCVMVFIGNVPAGAYTFSQTKKESPQDFNEFLDACSTEELERIMFCLGEYGEATPSAVRKALIWTAYNKLTYPFRSNDEVDYHGILQWAAKKVGVDSHKIETLSTYELEEEILSARFGKQKSQNPFDEAWNELSPDDADIANAVLLFFLWLLKSFDIWEAGFLTVIIAGGLYLGLSVWVVLAAEVIAAGVLFFVNPYHELDTIIYCCCWSGIHPIKYKYVR